MSKFLPRRAVPPFPGAKNSLPHCFDFLSFQPMVCSRPPLPIIRMFIAMGSNIVRVVKIAMRFWVNLAFKWYLGA